MHVGIWVSFPESSVGKESTCNIGDLDLIPGLGRSPGDGKGYPFQYSDLQNSMNCIVHGVSESQTTTEWLSLSLYNDKINIKKHKTHMPSRLCLLYNLCQQICVAIMGSACMHAKSLQSCLTLCNPLDYNLPGSSVHGILQARILEWGAILFSRRSSCPRNRTHYSISRIIENNNIIVFIFQTSFQNHLNLNQIFFRLYNKILKLSS